MCEFLNFPLNICAGRLLLCSCNNIYRRHGNQYLNFGFLKKYSLLSFLLNSLIIEHQQCTRLFKFVSLEKTLRSYGNAARYFPKEKKTSVLFMEACAPESMLDFEMQIIT